MLSGLHELPSHQPNTPNEMSLNFPNGTACMIGVDKTDIKRRANAMNSTTERGVAGRTLMATAVRPAICLAAERNIQAR